MRDVYLEGRWQAIAGTSFFQSRNPKTGETLPDRYPISDWSVCESMLDSAVNASRQLTNLSEGVIVDFLARYAEAIEANADAIVAAAAEETALPSRPRLLDVELPRTTHQLRLAAEAARDGAWRLTTVDEDAGLVSGYGPIGPVVVFGPNNFPLAFNPIAGGDFAAAIAAGNPVIAKAHPDHPRTTRLLAELAADAADAAGLPAGFVQLLWGIENSNGFRLVADARVGAVAFTGGRVAGLSLKQAADRAGTPFYGEMSSVNPVFFLSGAIGARGDSLAEEFAGSVLLGAGQFCTCPNLAVLPAGDCGERFLAGVADRFEEALRATLLSEGVAESLHASCTQLIAWGAELVRGGKPTPETRAAYEPTLLRVDADRFLESPKDFQTEGFGPLTLAVLVRDEHEWLEVAESIEGSLTGGVCFDQYDDDGLARELTTSLRWRVGRLLHNKMPTGVAVSPAMNHGGPFPASSHPGFTAVGLPAAMRRFAKLDCYDNVGSRHLPAWLQSECSPTDGVVA